MSRSKLGAEWLEGLLTEYGLQRTKVGVWKLEDDCSQLDKR